MWNLRTKTPHNEQTTVPWHQDNAYLDPTALNTLQPTAWIPLIDANTENGCMQVSSAWEWRGTIASLNSQFVRSSNCHNEGTTYRKFNRFI